MGEMLAQTERAKGELKRGPAVTPRNHGKADAPPTLADLGLSKRESADAQKLAALTPTPSARRRQSKSTEAVRRRKVRRLQPPHLYVTSTVPNAPPGHVNAGAAEIPRVAPLRPRSPLTCT